tara:strand:- start:958 stop:1482 length:525 start_codon:yes stop_codon:yes gene_type:complete
MRETTEIEFNAINNEYDKYSIKVDNYINYDDDSWDFSTSQDDMINQRYVVNETIFLKEVVTDYDNNDKIDGLYDSYKNVKILNDTFVKKNEKLESLLVDYDTKVATLTEFSDHSYFTLILLFGCVIFFLVTVILNVIEDKKEMNFLSKIMFFIIGMIILFIFLKKLFGYIQRKL